MIVRPYFWGVFVLIIICCSKQVNTLKFYFDKKINNECNYSF